MNGTDWLNWDSVVWGLIGLVGGTIVSYIFYLVENKPKKIAYRIQTRKLITEKISEVEGLEILYNGQSISDVSSSELFLQNISKGIIEQTDFASSKPLCVKTDGAFLFKDNVNLFLTDIEEDSGTTLKIIDNNRIEIDFEFWKKQAKTKLTLLHTGKGVSVEGVMKDGKIQESTVFSKREQIQKLLTNTTITIIVLALIVFSSILTTPLSGIAKGLVNGILLMFAARYIFQAYLNKKETPSQTVQIQSISDTDKIEITQKND